MASDWLAISKAFATYGSKELDVSADSFNREYIGKWETGPIMATTPPLSFEEIAKSAEKIKEAMASIKIPPVVKPEIRKKTSTFTFENVEDDYATGEEVRMATKFTKKQVGDALSPFVDKLDRAIAEWGNGFMLMEPRKVTHKNEEDSFGKLPLLGGETFEGVGAYEGKRDGIIFQFEAEGVKGLIEVNGADALDTLEGFGDFIRETLGFDLTEQMDSLVEKAKEEQQKKEIEEQAKAYEMFGSW